MTYFNDPYYDNSICCTREPKPASISYNPVDVLGERAIQAYNYFNSADPSSRTSNKYQRDYIYYGITPQNVVGTLYPNVRERICAISIDPSAYYAITDNSVDDPELNEGDHGHCSKKTSDYKDEFSLMGDLWNGKSYSFEISIISSGRANAESFKIHAFPWEVFDFNNDENVHRDSRKANWGRHHRYIYDLTIKNIGSRIMYIPSSDQNMISSWDIQQESLNRYMSICEFDVETTVSQSYTYDFSFSNTVKVNGKIQGTYSGITAEMGLDDSSTITTGKKMTITTTYNNKSDFFAKNMEIKYNNPIILGKNSDGTYQLNFINFGGFKFCMTAY